MPVVLGEGSKRPVDRAWQTKSLAPEEAERRFGNRPGLNVGVLLGPGFVIDLDFDGPTAEAEYAALTEGVDMPRTPTYTSTRGKHLIFAWDDRLEVGRSKFKLGDLEVRLGPALQSVLPPSVVDGFERAWEVSLEECAPAPLPDAVIERLIAAGRAVKPKSEPREKPKTPQDDFSDHGPPWAVVLEGWTHLGAGDYKRPGKEADGLSARVVKSADGRELLHVFTSEAPPFESLTNYSKFDAMRLLGFRGDEAAAEKAIREQGYGTRRHLQTFTLPELRSGNFAVTYLVHGVLVAGQPGIIAGSAKTLKTSVAADLATSIATGEKFLGCIDVPNPCPVAFMSGESGLATLQETFGRILESKGLTADDAEGVSVSPETIRLNKAEDVDAAARWLDDTGARVLFLDPTYLMMPGADAANLMIQGALMDDIKGVCQAKGVTMLLVHHIKKGVKSEFAPPQLHNIAWAGFQEFARQWVLLGRREKYEPGTGEHKLWLSVGGSAGHGNLWSLDIHEGVFPQTRYWDTYLSTSEGLGKPKKENVDDIKAKVLGVLAGGPDTVEGVRKGLKVKHETANAAVNELLAAGLIVPATINKNRRTWAGISLPTPSTKAPPGVVMG